MVSDHRQASARKPPVAPSNTASAKPPRKSGVLGIIGLVVLAVLIGAAIVFARRTILGSKLSAQCWQLTGGIWADNVALTQPVPFECFRLSFSPGMAPSRNARLLTTCGGLSLTVNIDPSGAFMVSRAERASDGCGQTPARAAELEVSFMLGLLSLDRYTLTGSTLTLTAGGVAYAVFDANAADCGTTQQNCDDLIEAP